LPDLTPENELGSGFQKKNGPAGNSNGSGPFVAETHSPIPLVCEFEEFVKQSQLSKDQFDGQKPFRVTMATGTSSRHLKAYLVLVASVNLIAVTGGPEGSFYGRNLISNRYLSAAANQPNPANVIKSMEDHQLKN